MREVTIARKGEYFRTLFELLLAAPDGIPAREATAAVERRLALAPCEQQVLKSGDTRFRKNFSFGTIDMVKAGWLAKRKGVWSITEDGRMAYRDYAEPAALYSRALALYSQWRSQQPASVVAGVTVSGADDTTQTTEQSIQLTFESAEEQAWAEVESFLHQMPPSEFETLVGDLLRAMGYHIAWKASGGKDGGIDLIAYTDPLGTRTPRIKVQVKRYTDNVTVEQLRSFLALLGHDEVGLFVTTSGFTRDAREAARDQQTRKVTLIDLERFFDLWVEHYPKLDDAARRRFPLQPIYFLAPAN